MGYFTVFYSFLHGSGRGNFHIDSSTGIVTTTSLLSTESGRLFHLEVMASDRGAPPKSSTGLVEIKINDNKNTPKLQFQNQTYYAQISESSSPGTDVIQVSFQKHWI